MNNKLSIRVHGPSFLECRRARGWSQEELSRRSGYSIRLIRKAESGGNLRTDTLQTICETFSQSHGSVRVEDISCSLVSIARRFIYCYDNYGVNLLDHCGELLTDDFVYHVHADPERVPYAGSWFGVDGLQKMLNIFFGMFERIPGTLNPAYLVGENRVHARFLDQAYFKGEMTPPIYINLHFQFRGAKVCQLDNEFDTDLTVKSLTSISANRFKIAPSERTA